MIENLLLISNNDFIRIRAWILQLASKFTFLNTVYIIWDFGTVVKNPSANAGDTGSNAGLGRSHMPRTN